jgi:putative membrane protein
MEVRIKNSTMREFAERFVKFWLTGEAKYAEEILLRNSEEFEGRVKCLRMNDFRLVSTDFHPGPFRDVGGARLVNLFDLPNTVYIHSPTFHGRDPVSEEDVLRIREALSCNGVELKPMRPFELESENFRVYCLPFDKKRLIFVSGKERIDDFIVESENFVVDCHNANFFGDLEAEEVREIEQLVRKAEVMHSEPSNNVKGAFVKISAETDSISRYISAVLLDYGSLKYAIVVFDSNNVEPQFREMVERRFSELGFTAIVCSTDNHSKTGIRVKESYRPAGGSKRDKELFEQLLEACKKAEFESVDFRYSESLVRAKVLGSLRDEIEKLSGRAGKYVYLFFVFIFLSWLLAIVSKVIYLL